MLSLGRGFRIGLTASIAAIAAWVGFELWVRTASLPQLAPDTSAAVLDRHGRLLRAYQVADGRWRLPVDVEQVDQGYIAQLIAYEDRRFWQHSGVDARALLRAAGQALATRRLQSGASTLSMQVVRLLTRVPTRSFFGKLRQIRFALALERQLTKTQVLELYLTLAPFGGNVEGVRAAALTWFGKEPHRLTPAQAALLVALPQAPAWRRPDRHPRAARRARDRVLARSVDAGALSAEQAAAARSEALPHRRNAFPQHGVHLADRLRQARPNQAVLRTTIDRDVQSRIERLLVDSADQFPRAMSGAVVVADHGSGEILASVGSPGLVDDARQGFNDMTVAVRSPGSLLKPLIYAMAFTEGLAHPESLIEDRPTAFGVYAPTNFDDHYRGAVTVRRALQQSRNVPAVVLLDALGPARFLSRMRRADVVPVVPTGVANLAIGLGGLGISLLDLVTLYTALARDGGVVPLTAKPTRVTAPNVPLMSPAAAWQVTDILAGAPAPSGSLNGQLAFKTGTSYGYRDAWAIGYDGRHVVGVWVGRADAAPLPGITGLKSAAPLLFDAFSRLKPALEPFAPPPQGVLVAENWELPQPLQRVRGRRGQRPRFGPEVAFPPDRARIETGGGQLALKVRNGVPPFTWLVNGRPVAAATLDRQSSWDTDGTGFALIAVVDSQGSAARVNVFLQ
ncbi:MAG: penicillin-binding protein 1C [Gammaproteobacteria bacterium]|nr:penicillin-binding protein 1C [Gammaproteobacteria bacterium]